MASVTTTVSVTCPHCDKVLRLSKRPAEGKKIKCPGCDGVFTPAFDDDDETAIQERPSLKTSAKSSARKRIDDDDEDERHTRKKSKQNAGRNHLLIFGLLGVGAFVLLLTCGGVGLTAFVWPGFLLTKKADDAKVAAKDEPEPGPGPLPPVVAPGGKNLASYVLHDATFVVGTNIKGLRDNNQLDGMLGQLDALVAAAGPVNAMPVGWKEIVSSCDKAMISFNFRDVAAQMPRGGAPGPFGGPPAGGQFGGALPRVVIAIQMANADAVARIKNLPNLGPQEKVGRYAVYRPGRNAGNANPLAFAGDRFIVMASLNDQDFVALLERAALNEPGPTQLLRLNALVEQSHFGAAWVLDAETRNLLQQGNGGFGPGGPPPGMPPIPGLEKIKGFGFAVDSMPGGHWKVGLHIDCNAGADAQSFKAAGEFIKNAALADLAKPQPFGQGPPKSLTPDIQGMNFAVQGAVMSAHMTISAATIGEIAKQIPAFGPPQPKQPPPFNPPPFNPPGAKQRVLMFNNVVAGKFQEERIVLRQGTRVTITVKSQVKNRQTDVDLYVYRGLNGENAVASDATVGPDSFVDFVVPATGTYRVRVVNLGPGNADSCRITIVEQ